MARSGGENINHFNAIRMRVTGAGNLKMTMFSYDSVESQSLIPFTLAATSNREPTRLVNFKEQRAQLEIRTSEIDETFRINRILIFLRPIASDYPG